MKTAISRAWQWILRKLLGPSIAEQDRRKTEDFANGFMEGFEKGLEKPTGSPLDIDPATMEWARRVAYLNFGSVYDDEENEIEHK